MNKRKFSIDWSKAEKTVKEQQNAKKSFKDDRIYYPQFKEDGTAQAIIRFIPSIDTDSPYVELYSHSYKGPGGFYIENCPTTMGKENKCPLCDANRIVWDEMVKEEQDARKRKVNYYANIVVIKDPLHPENEGKVYLFKYGFKIHTKVMEKWMPKADSIDEPIRVFDWYDGANFKLIIKKTKVGNKMMPNYDSSHFDQPSELPEELIEKINSLRYPLKDYRVFKTYDELKERLDKVMGSSAPDSGSSAQKTETKPTEGKKAEIKTESKTETKPEEKEPDEDMFAGSDDTFFSGLDNEEDK